MIEYARGDAAFAEWLREVDREVERLSMVGIFDLSDQPWRDYYEDGLPADVAAREVLASEGLDLEE